MLRTLPRPLSTPVPLFLALLAACGGEELPGADSPVSVTSIQTEGDEACPQGLDVEDRGLVILDPVDSARPYYVDFDVVPEGEVRTHTYRLANTDPRPVTVTKLQSSCGCAVPRVTAIAPDGTRTKGRIHGTGDVVTVPENGCLELEVRTDTEHVRVKNQHKLNSVRLTCDSENEPYLKFEQHLWVVLAFQATPSPLDLKQVPEGGGKTGATELFPAHADSVARVTGVRSASKGLTVDFHEEERINGTVTIVEVTLAPGFDRGPWSGEVWLETTENDGEGEGAPYRVPVRATVTTDVIASPASVILSDMDPEEGSTAEFVVRALIPGERLAITDVRATRGAEALEVDYEAAAPGTDGRSVRWNVRVHAGPELAGELLRGALEIDTDVGSVPTLRVPVTGQF